MKLYDFLKQVNDEDTVNIFAININHLNDNKFIKSDISKNINYYEVLTKYEIVTVNKEFMTCLYNGDVIDKPYFNIFVLK